MKTLRKIIALAVVAFNMACESDDILDKPTVPPSGELKKVSVTANLTPEIEEYSDGTMVYIWKGNATSNLVSEVNLPLLTNIAYDPENTQGFYPLYGTFNLWSDDYQHPVVGTCTGHSSYESIATDKKSNISSIPKCRNSCCMPTRKK